MLCEPVLNTGQTPILASSNLEQDTLMLHHVGTDHDIPFIFELLRKETSQSWDLDPLLEGFKATYAYIAGSHTSQAFIVELNGEPFFEIEAHKALMHVDLHEKFQPLEGDFYINLFAGDMDKTGPAVYLAGLLLCRDYFFGFPEVHRIIIPLAAGNALEKYTNLITTAGFVKIMDKSKPMEPDLYAISQPK